MKLSVVIPSYNEERHIADTVKDISAHLSERLSQQFPEYEILVVDDGSKDHTPSIIKALEKEVKGLRLIANAQNHGKGWVVKQGMLAATGDIRLFMDADNSTKIVELDQMLPLFEQGADAVIGSRRIQGANITVHQPWIRDFLGGVFRFIVHTVVPVGVTDSQCGFKAFTGSASMRVFPQQSIYRWAFDVEVLALARKMKFKIKEVPVKWMNEEASHVKLPGMVHMLIEIFQIRLNLWSRKYHK